MKLSTRGRYATRALLDLALHYQESPVTARDIAKRQQLSAQYLEHLIAPLKAAGLVKSVRGANGGFVLGKEPSLITISDIIRAAEGSTALVACVDDPDSCSRAPHCPTRRVWVDATRALEGVLESTTIQNMMDEHAAIMMPSGSY